MFSSKISSSEAVKHPQAAENNAGRREIDGDLNTWAVLTMSVIRLSLSHCDSEVWESTYLPFHRWELSLSLVGK